MAIVRPFRALRYNTGRFPQLAPLLAPPYDIISPAEQQALYERDPHNIIRLEYGKQLPEDSAADNRYTRARATLQEWMADSTLVMEDTPSYYLHQQRFQWAGQEFSRLGVFAAVELTPFDEGDVLPHEWTLKGPKVDRLQLMQTCEASFSPIFGLYDGANSELGALIARAAQQAPLATADNYGFRETLWRLDDPATVSAISAALATRQILIADGHHRYETMLALSGIMNAKYPDAPATAAFRFAFMELVELHDPGLLVMPTHRLLMVEPEVVAAFCKVAGAHFTLEKLTGLRPEDAETELAKHRNEHALLWYANDEFTLLSSPKSWKNGLPELDVQLLQEYLIQPLLALSTDESASVEQNVRYTHDPADAAARVDRGEAVAAILLNPTPVPDVLTLAAAGIRLPQKSTYFYPKIPTGLVMHNLRPEVTVG